MENTKERWIKKGRRTPLASVMEQARVHVSLGESHAEALVPYGWEAEKTAALASKVTELEQAFISRASDTHESRNATRNEEHCLRAARELIHKLRLAAPMVLRSNPSSTVTETAFRQRKPLGKSTVRMSKYLLQIRPFVTTLEEPLSVYFGGESPTAILDKVKDDLDKWDTIQETQRGGLPGQSLALYERVGEIVEIIEDLNRVALLAFYEQPELARQFNKNLLKRASRAGRRPAEALPVEESAVPAVEETPAPTAEENWEPAAEPLPAPQPLLAEAV